MNKNEIKIVKKTLKLLEKKQWNKLSLLEILNNTKTPNIKNKNDIFKLIIKYFDTCLKDNLNFIEKSSSKDMIFEIIMARLDILNVHRKSILNLEKYFKSNPQDLIPVLPNFIESMILMLTIAGINVNGVKGIPKIKTLMILYLLILFTWKNDNSENLEKTMTTLDNYLSNIDRLIRFF